MEEHLESISAHGRTQTILVAGVTFKRRLTLEVSVLPELYDPEEVFRVVGRAADWLKS